MIWERLAYVKAYWAIVVGLAIIAHAFLNYFKKGLNRIPGPFLHKISSIPRILSVYNNKSHLDDLALHKKYGKVVRLAPNLLSISDPAEIKQIYGIGTGFYKSRFYELSTAYDEEGLIPDTFVLTDKVSDCYTELRFARSIQAYKIRPYIRE